MADMNNPGALSLGRVGIDAPAIRSTTPYSAFQQDNTVGSLLEIGKSIAGGAIKEQRRKEFYEGQDRILQASLEGTQKEELRAVLDEQPWYMKIMGNGAVAEGAVEMASRVGAGKVFDEHTARLASGQDADITPDVYRQQVLDHVRSQRTGDEQVDSVFMPQMIAKAQGVISTQLQKHVEFQQKTTAQNAVLETSDSLTRLHGVVQAEQGAGATFNATTPMTPAVQDEYKNLVKSLDPEQRPKILDQEGWVRSKVALVVSALEHGDVAAYSAMHDAGLDRVLSAEDKVKIEDAQRKGKILNDGKASLSFINKRVDLEEAVLNAKTYEDIKKVQSLAEGLQRSYVEAGMTPPDDLKDRDAIESYVKKAIGSKHSEEEKQQRRLEILADRNEKLAKVQAEQATALSQTDAKNQSILLNAIADNPTADITIPVDGSPVRMAVTKEDRDSAYMAIKGKLMQMPPDVRQAKLQEYGAKSMEHLASKMQVVDEERKGNLTQLLSMTVGHSSDSKITGKGTMERIGKAAASIDHLVSTLPAVNIADYVEGDSLKKNLALYLHSMTLTGDMMGSWEASFGRDPERRATYSEEQLSKELKSSAVKDAVEASGIHGPEVQAWFEEEAKRNLLDGYAKDTKQAVQLAKATYDSNTEVVGKQHIHGVPKDYRIGAQIGVTDPATVSTATDLFIRSSLDKGWSYDIGFMPSIAKHVVIPIDPDGTAHYGSKVVMDYAGIKAMVSSKIGLEEARRKTMGNVEFLLHRALR